jgi:hypothetical protein
MSEGDAYVRERILCSHLTLAETFLDRFVRALFPVLIRRVIPPHQMGFEILSVQLHLLTPTA